MSADERKEMSGAQKVGLDQARLSPPPAPGARWTPRRRVLLITLGLGWGSLLLWLTRGGTPPGAAILGYLVAILALVFEPRTASAIRRRLAGVAAGGRAMIAALRSYLLASSPSASELGRPAPTLISAPGEEGETLDEPPQAAEPTAACFGMRLAYLRFPLALALAFFAQWRLEELRAGLGLSLGLYLAAAILLIWAYRSGDLGLSRPLAAEGPFAALRLRLPWLAAASVLSMLTLLASSNNSFRPLNLLLWGASMGCILIGLWQGSPEPGKRLSALEAWLRDPQRSLRIDGWSLLVLLGLGVVYFFRFYRLDLVPYEMWSDHAEKLFDVIDVLDGRYSIFFPRNTGREPLQFYLAALIAQLGPGISYLTLKISTAIAGFITLIYLYLFAREFGGKRVALAALLLAGVAYWPNTMSRLGLRFAFYPLFAAPALYHLLRGLRTRQPNQLILAGLFTGLGLLGYSPARVIPLAIILGVLLFILHARQRSSRWHTAGWLLAAGLVALVVVVPLLRAALEMPDRFWFRTLTRLSDLERPLPGNPLTIFLSNLWASLGFFGWSNGQIWAISIINRPALDYLSAAFFHLGVLITALRYARKRDWRDLFVLLLIPILMLPSTLSLAFPGENPAPNRASGAMVPAFTLAAVALAALPSWVERQWRQRRGVLLGLVVSAGLILLIAMNNFRLVFKEFDYAHRSVMLNTRDAGLVVKDFIEAGGSYANAHVIPYPYWFDTRLVSIVAGNPGADAALWPEEISRTFLEPAAQLFLLHAEDQPNLDLLIELFPQGMPRRFQGINEQMDFMIFEVPARPDLEAEFGS